MVGNSHALSGSLKELIELIDQDASLVCRNVIDVLDDDLLLHLLLPAVHGREDGVKEGVDQLADEDDVSGVLQVIEIQKPPLDLALLPRGAHAPLDFGHQAFDLGQRPLEVVDAAPIGETYDDAGLLVEAAVVGKGD